MKKYNDALIEQYRKFNDEYLRELVCSGNLTAHAQRLAERELRERGAAAIEPAPQLQLAAQHDSAEWQTVASFIGPTEAHIVMSRLEAEGIPAMLVDDQMAQSYHLISVAIGGVRIQVPATRVADARAILAAIEQGAFELPDDVDPDD